MGKKNSVVDARGRLAMTQGMGGEGNYAGVGADGPAC